MSEELIRQVPGVPLLSRIRLIFGDDDGQKGFPAFGQVLESMARSAVANCAPLLLVPPLSYETRLLLSMRGRASLRMLARSTQRRIRFIDRRDSIWLATRSYFLPIQRAIRAEIDPYYSITDLAQFFYFLALSARWSAQFYYNVRHVKSELDRLVCKGKRLPAEVAMRLSVLRGALGFLEHKQSLPGLCVRAGRELHFGDYLKEILEDAYLAEASVLRRFLSYEANKASIRRDLRRVLRAITTERRWSKGVVTVTEQLAVLPKPVLEIAGKLLQELCTQLPSTGGPVVLTSDSATSDFAIGRKNDLILYIEFPREVEWWPIAVK